MGIGLNELSKINLKPAKLEESLVVTEQLAGIIIKLDQIIDDLIERLNLNSNNSSKPPSTNLHKKPKSKKNSGRQRGAQFGHKGKFRELLPPEQVDQFVTCLPLEHCECGGNVELNNKKFHRHQVYEIPQPHYITTEYQIFFGICSCCNKKHTGQLPAGVTFKMFGPKTYALLSLLTSRYRLSKMLAKKLLAEIYSLPISVGSVSNIEGRVSLAITEPYQEVADTLKKEPIVHIDETGCKQSNKNGWLWVLTTFKLTLFLLSHSRGRKVAKELISQYQNRIIISDRYSSYNYIPDRNRQICWAHLKRDLQRIADRRGISGKLGYSLLKTYRNIFNIYNTTTHDYRLNHNKTKKRVKRLIRKFENLLLYGSQCGNKKTEQTCSNIINVNASLWTFLSNKQVEPTNNQAERQLRPIVIWRKLSFGTQSDRGSRFVERIFTVTCTCIQQGKSALSFLEQAVINYFSACQAPRLLTIQ